MRVEVNVQDYSPQAPGCLPQLIHRVLEHPFLYSCWLLSFLAFRDSLFQEGAAAFFLLHYQREPSFGNISPGNLPCKGCGRCRP